MFDLFKFLSKDSSSKDVAKDRLRLVLVHDRSNCSPEFLEMIRGDLLDALSQYMEIDEIGLDIKITRTFEGPDGKPALVASIPIKNMKRA
jgi:cell division topological specificity factor